MGRNFNVVTQISQWGYHTKSTIHSGSVGKMSHRKWNFSPFGATHTIKWAQTESNSISGATFCVLTRYIKAGDAFGLS